MLFDNDSLSSTSPPGREQKDRPYAKTERVRRSYDLNFELKRRTARRLSLRLGRVMCKFLLTRQNMSHSELHLEKCTVSNESVKDLSYCSPGVNVGMR